MTAVNVGTTAISTARMGGTQVQKLYMGTTLVWSPPLVFSDDFNRADAPDPGSNWVFSQNPLSLPIVGNKIYSTSGHPAARFLPSTALGPDMWAEADLDASPTTSPGSEYFDACQGPAVRIDSSGNNYYIWFNQSDGNLLEVWGRKDLVWVRVGPQYPLPSLAGRYRIEAEGSTIRAYRNDVLLITGIDTRITDGDAGIYGGIGEFSSGTSSGMWASTENFRCGNLPYTPLATGPRTWTRSPATATITGTSATWSATGAAQTWTRSAVTVTAAVTSGVWSVVALPQTWTRSAATATVTATSGAWSVVVPGGPFYTDNFNRANGALGANWLGDGLITIVSNKAQSGGSSHDYYNATIANDQWAEGVVTVNAGIDGSIGPMVRYNTANAHRYYVWIDTVGGSPGRATIFRFDGGYTSLGTPYVLSTLADVKVRIEAEGTTIRLYVNDVLRITATDSTLSSGRVGMDVYTPSATVTLDNWRGGDLPYTP